MKKLTGLVSNMLIYYSGTNTIIVYQDKSLILARSVTERLVQRLISCAGMLDPRFASKFIISNHQQIHKVGKVLN